MQADALRNLPPHLRKKLKDVKRRLDAFANPESLDSFDSVNLGAGDSTKWAEVPLNDTRTVPSSKRAIPFGPPPSFSPGGFASSPHWSHFKVEASWTWAAVWALLVSQLAAWALVSGLQEALAAFAQPDVLLGCDVLLSQAGCSSYS
eukprot:g31558.t1